MVSWVVAIEFRSSPRPTVGIEWELALVDKTTRDLANKASELFDEVHRHHAPIIDEARLHKATAHRLLAALEREGMVTRDASGDRYRLGPEAIALGARAARATDLHAASREEVTTLAAATGETATFEVPAGRDMLILDEALGRSLIGATASIGTRWPMHATSTGKAYLASLPEEDARPWPEEIVMSEEVQDLVTRRWAEYGIT